MYLIGKKIKDFRKGIIIVIIHPKKKQRIETREEYRNLNLNIHVSKVITGVIKNRIEN